ncbi:MAG: beta-hydroxyacyl-ACP dehydratase [Puniceicoccales bacterium]|jgi:3-hydroxyacyl-[acyl-carrier-protein] dehydratase|nr:beta-hydroxyacyl-ACP dehydratase [Puniceicoccales bacterium]
MPEHSLPQQAVLDAIPHRKPFLFIDTIRQLRSDGITCERTLCASESFYEGHYPGNPITPGVLLCEAVFQAGAIFLSAKLKEDKSFREKTPVLCRIESARFKKTVLPGDIVTVDVAMRETLQGFHFMSGKVSCNGHLVLTLRFALALVDKLSPAVVP